VFESKVVRRIFGCKLKEATVSCTEFHSNMYLHHILMWLYMIEGKLIHNSFWGFCCSWAFWLFKMKTVSCLET